MLWQLSHSTTSQLKEIRTNQSCKTDLPIMPAPLRKVLSKSLLTGFTAAVDSSSVPRTPTCEVSPALSPIYLSKRSLSSSPPKLLHSIRKGRQKLPVQNPGTRVHGLKMSRSSSFEEEITDGGSNTSKHLLNQLLEDLHRLRQDLVTRARLYDADTLLKVQAELQLTMQATIHHAACKESR